MYLTTIYKTPFPWFNSKMKLYLFVTFIQTIFGLSGRSLISEPLPSLIESIPKWAVLNQTSWRFTRNVFSTWLSTLSRIDLSVKTWIVYILTKPFLISSLKESDLAGLSRDQLDQMFQDQWARRKRSIPILPGINGGYGSSGDSRFSQYGKRTDIDDILGQGFIGK